MANKKEPEKNIKSIMDQGVKKSILSVGLIVISLVFLLSLIGKAGVVGVHFDRFLSLAFGWGRYVLPFLILAVGIIYFKRLEKIQYYLTSAGAFILFLFLLVSLHSFFDLSTMVEVAKDGGGGGYVGLALAFILVKYLGQIAAIIVSLGFLAVGIILTFNFPLENVFYSIKDFFVGIKEKASSISFSKKTFENEDDVAEEYKEEEDIDEDGIKIKSIEFVEDPNDAIGDEDVKSDFENSNNVSKKNNKKKSSEKDGLLKNIFGKVSEWRLPPVNLLEKNGIKAKPKNLEKNAQVIKKTLHDFGIEVEVSGYNVGPTVVQYTFKPAVGVKLSRIMALQNDLALALAAHSVRIEAPIPGKSLVGVEVPLPDDQKSIVKMRSALETEVFGKKESNLTVILGEDVNGDLVLSDIKKMPHMMIAGSTNTGKSVCVNSILTALLYQNSPEELKFIMVDPKRVELSFYNGIPHLLTPVIVDTSKVINALKWAVGEMERRYRVLQDIGSKDIHSYNKKVSQGQKKQVLNEETGKYDYEELEKMPFIVVVIDELADLMASHGKEVEGAIVRLAQMSRAVGIHLIVSTQRPEVKIITGLIKANIATRVALKVATQIDSRTILGMAGAEKLLGNGDLLFSSVASSKPRRVQGVYISEEEIQRVVKFIKQQAKEIDFSENEDLSESLEEQLKSSMGVFSGPDTAGEKDEELFEEAKHVVIQNKKASTSFLQRKFGIGYSRAARLMDMLEEAGVVSPAEGTKPRQILMASGDVGYEDDVNDQQNREGWK